MLSQTTYPAGTAAARTYNAHRLLYQTQIGGVTQATFTYDTADRRSQRLYANGVQTNWTLDANSRTTDLSHLIPGMPATVLQEWTYSYTNADDPQVQNDVTPTYTVHGEAYQYDGLHRVGNYQTGTVAGNYGAGADRFPSLDLDVKVGDWSSWGGPPSA